MAAHRFLTNNLGVITEEFSVATSAGVGDKDKLVALNASGILPASVVNSVVESAGSGDSGKLPALDATGKLDLSFMPEGVKPDTVEVVAFEALAAGDFVNVYNASGTAKCRKANATAVGKEAHGFVIEAFDADETATIYFEGTNNFVAGLSHGPVFLSTTGGLATSTAPAGSGNIVQRIGFSVTDTSMNFQSLTPFVALA
jgi:hypothetical protein